MATERMTTTDHDEIRRWMEDRGALPAAVKNTLAGDVAGVLYVDFPGASKKDVAEISWEAFFKTFDAQNLAFVYQETTPDGDLSHECALVARESGESVRA